MAQASIEDWLGIHNLFVRYTTAMDHGDVEGIVSCFRADAVLESPIVGTYSGPAGVREFAERTARPTRQPGVKFRHVVSNLAVDVEGNRARATCYLLDFVTRGGKTELLSPGEYRCEATKADGQWLFGSRVVIMDRPFTVDGL